MHVIELYIFLEIVLMAAKKIKGFGELHSVNQARAGIEHSEQSNGEKV